MLNPNFVPYSNSGFLSTYVRDLLRYRDGSEMLLMGIWWSQQDIRVSKAQNED